MRGTKMYNIGKKLTNNDDLIKIINKIRKNIKKNEIEMTISPRAIIDCTDLLNVGYKIEDVINIIILKDVNMDIRIKILKDIDFNKFKSFKDETKLKEIETSNINYIRNLKKYQTYIIWTNKESIGTLTRIEPLNNLYKQKRNNPFNSSFCFGGFGIQLGDNWCHQYDNSYLFFAGNRKGGHLFSEFEKPNVVRFLNYCDSTEDKITLSHPVVFEFIQKGYKKPYKIIIIGK